MGNSDIGIDFIASCKFCPIGDNAEERRVVKRTEYAALPKPRVTYSCGLGELLGKDCSIPQTYNSIERLKDSLGEIR